MTDTLEIFGTEYSGVTGIKATDDNNNILTYIRPQGTKSITSNGNGIDVAEYASVDVSVSGGSPVLQTKTKTYTPTESAQSETVTYDGGYDGLDEVSISVGAISSTYVGSGITQRTSSDLTASGATVTAPAGYYASQATKTVASGTAGTPTATKGTVTNHSVTVTPSVTNTTGYITGSTKTGTAVTVSASELVSGSETKTSNGTYDVTNLASLIVNVSGGSGLEYETGTYTPTDNTARPTISFSKTHSKPPILVVIADATNSIDSTASTNRVMVYVDYYQIIGSGVSYNSSSYRYGLAHYVYKGSNGGQGDSSGTLYFSYDYTNTGSSTTSYPRYWANESGFKPYTNSNSRYWRTTRTYKWIAVWK